MPIEQIETALIRTSIFTYRSRPRSGSGSRAARGHRPPRLLIPISFRHTAASLAIASGAGRKVVQQMLGHSSATMTLDTYGHLFEDRLDEVGSALDAARTAAQHAAPAPRALPRVAPALPSRIGGGTKKRPRPSVSAGQDPFSTGTPDRIRTGATALRGRRARPLHNGGKP